MKKIILVPLAFAFLMPVTLFAVLIGQQKSDFDPGIRPVTAASLQAEKASEDAWFAHLQVLASDDLKGRRTGTPIFFAQPIMSSHSSNRSISYRQEWTDTFSPSTSEAPLSTKSVQAFRSLPRSETHMR
jgi:hypothetical protein